MIRAARRRSLRHAPGSGSRAKRGRVTAAEFAVCKASYTGPSRRRSLEKSVTSQTSVTPPWNSHAIEVVANASITSVSFSRKRPIVR